MEMHAHQRRQSSGSDERSRMDLKAKIKSSGSSSLHGGCRLTAQRSLAEDRRQRRRFCSARSKKLQTVVATAVGRECRWGFRRRTRLRRRLHDKKGENSNLLHERFPKLGAPLR
jgi:hypothetical protein